MKPNAKLLTSTIAAVLAGPFLYAADQTWDGGSAGTGSAWFTSSNWVGDAGYPGSQSVTTNTDIATFTATGTNTTVGINMNFTGNTHYLGAIEMTGNRTRTFGNSSTTASGSLVLNGATVNSVANTILRNSSSNLMTLQNTQSSGDKAMDVVLGNATDNIIQVTSSGGVTISSKITGTDRQLSRQGTDTGTGSLTLSGDNTFSGGLNYSGLGTLALQHSNAAGSGTINFASTQTGTTATFTVSGGINIANNIVMDAATGRNTVNSLGIASNTLSGNITINNNSSNQIVFQNSASVGSGTTFTIGGATPNSTTITAATYSNTISFRASQVGELGALNSRINAPNAQVNANNNGIWTINSSGSSWSLTSISTSTSGFVLGAHDALATGARVEVNSGGQIDLNGYNQTVAGLAGSSSIGQILNNSATTGSVLTLAGLTANRNYASSINDGTRKLSLVMNSSGRVQTLSGTNTYSGPTTVSAGTLLVNGSLGNTSVTVEANGVLGGTGSIGDSLSFAANSQFQVVDFNDPLAVTGNITFGSGFGIANLLGIDWDGLGLNTPYTVISTTQTFGTGDIGNFGLDNRVAVGNTDRQAYFTNGSLAVVVIPEPGAGLLAGLGLGLLLRRRRN